MRLALCHALAMDGQQAAQGSENVELTGQEADAALGQPRSHSRCPQHVRVRGELLVDRLPRLCRHPLAVINACNLDVGGHNAGGCNNRTCAERGRQYTSGLTMRMEQHSAVLQQTPAAPAWLPRPAAMRGLASSPSCLAASPASGPRPASSTPATSLYPWPHSSCSNSRDGPPVAALALALPPRLGAAAAGAGCSAAASAAASAMPAAPRALRCRLRGCAAPATASGAAAAAASSALSSSPAVAAALRAAERALRRVGSDGVLMTAHWASARPSGKRGRKRRTIMLVRC